MSNDTVVSLAAPARVCDPLTELLRTGARRLVEAAVTAEFEEYLSGFVQEKLPDGRQRVVRNGHLPERKILTGLGEVDVRVPKSRSRSGSPEPFRSSVVPPYVRRCASLDAAIPWLYLHGVSTGQMRPAVAALVGEEAARGLSANVVSRLKRSWDEEYRQFWPVHAVVHQPRRRRVSLQLRFQAACVVSGPNAQAAGLPALVHRSDGGRQQPETLLRLAIPNRGRDVRTTQVHL